MCAGRPWGADGRESSRTLSLSSLIIQHQWRDFMMTLTFVLVSSDVRVFFGYATDPNLSSVTGRTRLPSRRWKLFDLRSSPLTLAADPSTLAVTTRLDFPSFCSNSMDKSPTLWTPHHVARRAGIASHYTKQYSWCLKLAVATPTSCILSFGGVAADYARK